MSKRYRGATPSFVLELPLRVTSSDVRRLGVIFFSARQVYNACLGEALARLERLRDSRAYRRALRLPRGPLRHRLFKEVRGGRVHGVRPACVLQ